MRILIDLQCCQTPAAARGIGRYSMALARHAILQGARHDFSILLNAAYPAEAMSVIDQLSDLLDPRSAVFFAAPPLSQGGLERQVPELAANLLRNARILSTTPDLYHVSSVFEGESINGSSPAHLILPERAGLLRTSTAYDLVPLLYPKEYIGGARHERWLLELSATLRRYDGLFALSEATKSDHVRLLGIEPDDIHVIYGGVGAYFQPREQKPGEADVAASLEEDYILYVGGTDYRKNLEGLLEGYALASRSNGAAMPRLRVITALEQKRLNFLQKMADDLGVGSSTDFVGFVEEAELVRSYQNCKLFVFPSHYEGLGLPVIEAMQCGAPVLVADNSSLSEIVENPDDRFDAAEPTQIATALNEALASPSRLAEMSRYGLRRAQDFTWAAAAERLLAGWEDLSASKARPRARERQLRVAVFTPLPPNQTGIATYSAELLEHLCRRAAVTVFVDRPWNCELPETVEVLIHKEFLLRASTFDAVIYQFGNSPFHWYMLPYARAYPGIAVIHDAFLGYLYYLDYDIQRFWSAALRDNAAKARSTYHQVAVDKRPIDGAVNLLPMCRELLEVSDRVIVHSAFAAEILKAECGPATCAPIAVVPQVMSLAPLRSAAERVVDRQYFGLGSEQFVVCSFGHVSHTKAPSELINSFATFVRETGKDARLIFAGPFAVPLKDELLGEAAKLGLGAHVEFAGHLDDTRYHQLMGVADVVVQLRKVTRGETSRAMLDALAHGTPLICNRLGAAEELPRHAVMHIDGTSAEAIAAALIKLAANPDLRDELSRAGRTFVERELSPEVVVDKYLDEAISARTRSRSGSYAPMVRGLRELLATTGDPDRLRADIASAYGSQQIFDRPSRLLIDVTHIREHDLGTGIQRVVRELTRALYRHPNLSLEPQTVAFVGKQFVMADDYAQACGARLDIEAGTQSSSELRPRPGDVLLLGDGVWHLADAMLPALKAFRAAGGNIVGIVYDLIPITRPDLFPDYVGIALRSWLVKVLGLARHVVCISAATANRLMEYIERENVRLAAGLQISVSHCGCDVNFKEDGSAFGLEVFATQHHGKRPFFLMVGTIEPRKGHDVVLDAFDIVWSKDLTFDLVIVGKTGWAGKELMERISDHEMLGTRLHMLGAVSDRTLVDVYKRCSGVIVASIDEGFGLPIFEAANFGCPVVLSDIEVFRELAGSAASYFAHDEPDKLAEIVLKAASEPLQTSVGIKPITWAESANQLVSILGGPKIHAESQ